MLFFLPLKFSGFFLAHNFFNFFDGDRRSPVSEYTASVFRNQNIVLQANSSEIFISFDLIIIQEILV